ncbi:hypothetical protein JCM6882_001781 [Rhodosporidiobolus microsporus]
MLSRPTSSNPQHPSPSPLTPTYILRAHSAPVSVLRFTRDGRFLLSADTEGFVAVWDLKTFRPLYFWRAPGAGEGASGVGEGQGVLGVEELGGEGGVLTQGRDNFLRLFRLPVSSASVSTTPFPAATSVPSPSAPSHGVEKEWEMDINAMNFCRVSLLRLDGEVTAGGGKGKGKETGKGGEEALVAVVSLTKDEFVDVFHYPSKARIHRSIGSGAFDVGEKTGSVMAVHLFQLPSFSSPSPNGASTSTSSSTSPSPSAPSQALHLLIAYESGHLVLFRFTSPSALKFTRSESGLFDEPVQGRMVEEGEGWEVVWKEKGHRDAVMSLSVDPSHRFAYTVGADHFVCKYRIFDLNEEEAALPRMMVEETTSPGKAAIAVRGDGKLVAAGGWDGECRLYSARSLSPLAVLSHHRSSLQAVAFSPILPSPSSSSSSSPSQPSLPAAPPFLPVEEDSDISSEDDDREGVATSAGAGRNGSSAGRRKGRGKVWLAAAGQEGKISLWEVYPPS